jgi:hypothetical protein
MPAHISSTASNRSSSWMTVMSMFRAGPSSAAMPLDVEHQFVAPATRGIDGRIAANCSMQMTKSSPKTRRCSTAIQHAMAACTGGRSWCSEASTRSAASRCEVSEASQFHFEASQFHFEASQFHFEASRRVVSEASRRVASEAIAFACRGVCSCTARTIRPYAHAASNAP